jgi:hypothetical protein
MLDLYSLNVQNAFFLPVELVEVGNVSYRIDVDTRVFRDLINMPVFHVVS